MVKIWQAPRGREKENYAILANGFISKKLEYLEYFSHVSAALAFEQRVFHTYKVTKRLIVD